MVIPTVTGDGITDGVTHGMVIPHGMDTDMADTGMATITDTGTDTGMVTMAGGTILHIMPAVIMAPEGR